MPNRRLFHRDVFLAEITSGVLEHNVLWYCPTCGDPWGRAAGPGCWMATAAPCRACPGRGTDLSVPGSFLREFEWWSPASAETRRRLLLASPRWLEHEFFCHLDETQRRLNQNA